MTEKLKKLFENDYLNTARSIHRAFSDFVGPKTTQEIWEVFSNSILTQFRDGLEVRGSAKTASLSALNFFFRNPTSEATDMVLRMIQEKTENEIYPGARKDLGIEE